MSVSLAPGTIRNPATGPIPLSFIYGQADPTLFDAAIGGSVPSSLGRKISPALTTDYKDRHDPNCWDIHRPEILPPRHPGGPDENSC